MTRFTLMVLFVWQVNNLIGQIQPIIVNDNTLVINLNDKVEYFYKRGKHFNFNEVLNESESFRGDIKGTPNFSNKSSDIWFKFTVSNKVGEPLYLQISNLYIAAIDIYLPGPSGKYKIKHAGLSVPFSKREFPSVNSIVELDNINTNQPYTVYGNLRTADSNFWVPMEIGTLPAIVSKTRNSEFVTITVLAILAVMLFYNTLIAFVVREKVYFFYIFYVFSASFYIFYYHGYFFEWFEPWVNPIISIVPLALFYIGILMFTSEILNLKKNTPWIYWAIYVLYAISIIMILGQYLPILLPSILVDFMNIGFPIFIFTASLHCMYKKIRVAYFFMIGWLPLMIAGILYTLIRIGLFYHHFFILHGVGIAMAWEVTLFSLMLGYRFNVIRQERIKIQAENLRLVNEHNLILEESVRERTKEISRQNFELKQYQEKIIAQRDLLGEQNKKLEESRYIIDQYNQELEFSVHRRTLELAESNEALKNQFHQLEQFSFIAAHNLRGPVARILGLANIIATQKKLVEEYYDDDTQVLYRIVNEAKGLDAIIHDLIAILNIRQKKSYVFEWVSFPDLIDKLLEKFKLEIEANNIKLNIRIEVQHIFSIAVFIDSVLSNLISNAIKYRVKVRQPVINLVITMQGNKCCFLIEDNGIGFDYEKFADKVFEPFQRFNMETEGKGLGMFLVKAQVQALAGTITLSSQIGKGTKVEIALPINKEIKVGGSHLTKK